MFDFNDLNDLIDSRDHQKEEELFFLDYINRDDNHSPSHDYDTKAEWSF